MIHRIPPILIVFCWAFLTFAQDTVITTASVNIRSCGSINCSRVWGAPSGTTLTVLGQANGWYNIRTPKGVEGWVASGNTRAGTSNTAASQNQQEVPQNSSPSNSDNKCFEGWVCTTDQDWIDGYNAKQAELAGHEITPPPPSQPTPYMTVACEYSGGLLGPPQVGVCVKYTDGSLKWLGPLWRYKIGVRL